MKITDLVLFELTGEFAAEEEVSQERQAQPLDVYPEFGGRGVPIRDRRRGELVTHRATYLEVCTDEGVTGLFGPVDGAHAYVLSHEIRDFVIGRDPLAIETLWDQLLRRNRHGRSGYYMMAMSALDCALWDLKGKALGQPVYRLLGGPTRDKVPAYASMLGYALEREALQRKALEYKEAGYHAQKWFFRWGPGDGPEGAARNLSMAVALREAVAGDVNLMFDAFNSWDVPYAVDMARRIAPLRPLWLEEPVPVDRLEGLRQIRLRGGVPVATGEHLYTRWQVKQLLAAEAADVVQADPDWCGGISELVKIAAVCSSFDLPLYPHGHSLHAALHVAAACSPTVLPMVEFLFLHQRNKQRFVKGYLEPVNGAVSLPQTPGLGIEIDPSRVKDRRTLS